MIALGDFNQDGNVDIVATSNQIFSSNGDGTVAAPVADFNGDGLPDLMFNGYGVQTVALGKVMALLQSI